MDESKDPPRLIAAPRHLRRRRFRPEIPDTLLVRGLDTLPRALTRAGGAKRQSETTPVRVQAFGRKRAVALFFVIFVAISIPALVFALILAG